MHLLLLVASTCCNSLLSSTAWWSTWVHSLLLTTCVHGLVCVYLGGRPVLEEAVGGVCSGQAGSALPHGGPRKLQPPAGPHEPGLQAAGQPPGPGSHPAVLQKQAWLHCAWCAGRGGGMLPLTSCHMTLCHTSCHIMSHLTTYIVPGVLGGEKVHCLLHITHNIASHHIASHHIASHHMMSHDIKYDVPGVLGGRMHDASYTSHDIRLHHMTLCHIISNAMCHMWLEEACCLLTSYMTSPTLCLSCLEERRYPASYTSHGIMPHHMTSHTMCFGTLVGKRDSISYTLYDIAIHTCCLIHSKVGGTLPMSTVHVLALHAHS